MEMIALENRLQSRDKLIEPIMEYGHTKIVQLQLKAGSGIPAHSAKTDLLVVVQKGRVQFTGEGTGEAADGPFELSPDKLLRIPSGVRHSVLALEDTIALLIFT
ncbi:MAG: hypothetical protein K0Q59_3456 [Paenibacillus sp.]|jgi:quercetin dioxygenase-like cupin family protein|nr:hypothetical protein [Paenibacillus sp.]